MPYRKKLIEVALPLEAINEASAREKSIRHGHPSTLHLWWARRPLAAARAVIFASLVDDPDADDAPSAFVAACRALPKGKNASDNDTPRMRLFDFIERLVQWESTTDEAILTTARDLINLATDGNPPPLLDPFAGGGSIPLEAQRLGLEAHASDLNPVAVMINKAMIEIPPRFANQPPVNPRDREQIASKEAWRGAAGLAADVRYYGEWMRERAWDRIGHFYPTHNGETVIAWLWARTVKSPNPAIDVHVPLIRSFEISSKKNNRAWIEPRINRQLQKVSFILHQDSQKPPAGTIGRNIGGARCILSGEPITWEYLKHEGKAGRIGFNAFAVVTEGQNQRNFHSVDNLSEFEIKNIDFLDDIVATEISGYFNPPLYGHTSIGSMFIPRQRLCLKTFADLVAEARLQCVNDGHDESYANAISLYLTLGIGRLANRLSSFTIWNKIGLKIEQTFSEQGVGMAWDFAEANPFSNSTGSWSGSLGWIPKCLEAFPAQGVASVVQKDAASLASSQSKILISTDPPYYASITYADFADYFYGLFRYTLKDQYPDLFSTMATPKIEEAVAAWHRFGGDRTAASQHFTTKLMQAVNAMVTRTVEGYPVTVYYAFKESELEKSAEGYLTAWESILSVLILGGFQIIQTWPVRTERTTGRKERKNSLASSIVLVCRPRPDDAPTISRRDFVSLLRRELPAALREMQSGNIAPVDLAQAAIGPGMAVYSRYRQVLEANGDPLTVRAALQLINQELDAYLSEQEGDVDSDTRFAISWFEQTGFDESDFGLADVLARAKNTSVDGVVQAGIAVAGRGKVRLRHWEDADWVPGWDPTVDSRVTVWEATHHLIYRLTNHGESGAANLLIKLDGEIAGEARQLAYRLYSICERKGWADHARAYNSLVISWPAIQEEVTRLQQELAAGDPTVQGRLL